MDFAVARTPMPALPSGGSRTALEERVANLLHQRLGYDRLLNDEVPPVVYLDKKGRLFSTPVSGDAARTLRFKLIDTNTKGLTYSLLLHHRDFQFTVVRQDGAITFGENGDFSEEDRVLLGNLLRHLETASRRRLMRRPKSINSLWQRLFDRRRLATG